MLAALPTPARASLEDTMPAFELLLSPSQLRRLRAVLCEEFERLEWLKATMPRSHIGYHMTIEAMHSDLHDVYQQIVCARSALAGV